MLVLLTRRRLAVTVPGEEDDEGASATTECAARDNGPVEEEGLKLCIAEEDEAKGGLVADE